MNYQGFIGPAYVSQSPNAAAETLYNWMPTAIEAPEPARFMFDPRPGLTPYVMLDDFPVRGLFSEDGNTYAVAGSSVYLITSGNASWIRIGSLSAKDSNPVTIVSNGVAGGQLYIPSGGKGNIVNTTAQTVSPITAAGYPTNTPMGAFLDSYFLTVQGNTQQFNISNILNGTLWDALDFDIVTQTSDNLVALEQFNKVVWMFGSRTTIPFYDASTTFPFLAVPQVLIEIGCVAPFSVCKNRNAICWLHRSERGQGQFLSAGGDYSPRRISTYAVEQKWAQYPTMTDCVAFTMEWLGHELVVLNFPSGNATWVYDFTESANAQMPMWSRWSWWNTLNSNHDRFRGWVHCKSPDGHLVGDWETGQIYTLDNTNSTDAAQPIVWERTAPHLNNSKLMMFHSEFQVDMETGLGGSTPQALLSWSDDGGHTFSNPAFQMSTGTLGNYLTRCRLAGNLGQSRDRVYRYRVSNNAPPRPFAAYLNVLPGTN